MKHRPHRLVSEPRLLRQLRGCQLALSLAEGDLFGKLSERFHDGKPMFLLRTLVLYRFWASLAIEN
ncbi:hypothetical protein, partial [Acidovorax sp.]|uniref:hypothetical protein n=1 Tax=Acidovorax sp. TaxID=1872122 RepID=UPI00391F9FD9